MAIDKDFVLSALLRYNYLPKQTKRKDEIPPVLSSVSFSDLAARRLQSEKARRKKGYPGYDSVEYQLTRFDKVPRVLSIPHPKAYADLVLCIAKNWSKMSYVTAGENSLLEMKSHADGRMVIMNYENPIKREHREIERSFGKHFIAETDIANFYPSIYSHAIAWALVGFDAAKKEREKTWYNDIDKKVRMAKRNETNGIAIGPATSNIIAETILARVDQEIAKHFSFVRFSDDYAAYCDTEKESHDFIMKLSRELGRYGLKLGARKTKISPLPRPASQAWIAHLQSILPRGSRISARRASQYLGLAFSLAEEYPDKSVMKYAIRSILSSALTKNAHLEILPHALNLAVHRAELLPVISGAMNKISNSDFDYAKYLPRILAEHVRFGHSDAISWALYYCQRYSIEIEDSISEEIISSHDCIPILLLYLMGDRKVQEKIASFALKLDKDDLYFLDKYWILLYQLFLDGLIPQPYPADDCTFEILQDEGVTFVDHAPGRS